MSSPRHAAPDDDLDLATAHRAWRRYLVWVGVGCVAALVGLGLFSYLGWWALCDQVVGTCRRGEPGIFWGSAAAASILGAIIGVLCQVWLERRRAYVIAAVLAGVVLTAATAAWLAV